MPSWYFLQFRLQTISRNSWVISRMHASLITGPGAACFANRLTELGFKRVESYDPFSLPAQPSGQFDIITCTEVIEHIPSPLTALQEMQSLAWVRVAA